MENKHSKEELIKMFTNRFKAVKLYKPKDYRISNVESGSLRLTTTHITFFDSKNITIQEQPLLENEFDAILEKICEN